MKHLNTYEYNQLQKYILYKNNNILYTIFKINGVTEKTNIITNIKRKMISLSQKYYYQIPSDNLAKTNPKEKNIHIGLIDFNYHKVLYTTNNLKDCVNMIKIIIDTKKYNL